MNIPTYETTGLKISIHTARKYMFGMGDPGACISQACNYLEEYAGCEPDAEAYTCPDCGLDTLYGLERLIEADAIEVYE